MSEENPERWLRSAAAEDSSLAALLEAGRAEKPSAAQLDALAKRLEPTFSAPPSGGAGAAGAATAGTPLAPLVIGTLLSLGIAAAWLSTRDDDERASETPRHVQPLPTAVRALPAPVPAPRAPAPAAPEREPEAQPPVADAAPGQQPARPQPKPAAARPAQDPAAELVLLEQAHRNLAAAPRRALEATAAHRRLFPHGQYEQEREVLAIEALFALHEGARAAVRAARFLARHPESSHARRVRALFAASAQALTTDAGARRAP